jgi:monovalent cation:H+ antiporter-2, CPA2 family
MDHGVLPHIILSYAIALVLVVGLARLRVPAIVAMMLAGVVAGPSGLRVISEPAEVEMLAELGIVLLLFTVGLDFSLAAVRQIWRAILIAGTLQITLTAGVIAGLAMALARYSPQLALFIGLFIALSSTAIVLQGLAARNELSSPHGRLTVGILLLQDLAIVVLLLLVPILSGKTPLSSVPGAVGRAALAIAAVAGGSRLVLPLLLRLVTASGRREAFPMAIVIAAVGTAWLGSMMGLSMAVGAFLAGLMLAESEYSHQAYAEVRPVRDILSGLFFISLGMLIDIPSVLRQLHIVIAVTAGIMLVKAAIASASLRIAAAPLRIAVTSGVGLAQIGEFSFIMGQAGLDAGLLPASVWQVMLGASVTTMVLTPLLLSVAPSIGAWLGLRWGQAATELEEAIPHLSGHVIVLGFGVGGQLVSHALRELKVPYLILELNGATVRRAKSDGELIFYGDATSPESLHAAHAKDALAIVSLVSDPDGALRMVKAARELSSALPIIVRARYRSEADRLQAAGATVAVAEELETSLEVLAQLLARLHIAGNIIESLLDRFRRHSETLRPVRAPRSLMDALPAEIQQMPISTHEIGQDDWSTGRSIGELDLRAKTNASIMAIQRGGRYITAPSSQEQLEPGDVLYLVGDEADVLLARDVLANGGRTAT